MKKLILLSIILIVGCNPHQRKYFYENPIAEIRMEICEDKCKVYEYDDKYIELTDDYEHPWCICMTQCYVERGIMVSDSSYCSATNNNPLNSLKNKIKYSIKSDSTHTY